jgi:hypothetical protein
VQDFWRGKCLDCLPGGMEFFVACSTWCCGYPVFIAEEGLVMACPCNWWLAPEREVIVLAPNCCSSWRLHVLHFVMLGQCNAQWLVAWVSEWSISTYGADDIVMHFPDCPLCVCCTVFTRFHMSTSPASVRSECVFSPKSHLNYSVLGFSEKVCVGGHSTL